jgi:CHAT domain-containing protein
MVVLSASDTAKGKIMVYGVLNLPRALMIARVPCVGASQWQVDDSSTCDLMKGFYQDLKSGKDVSSSLCATMLQMLKAKCKIHEWAPFVVYGLPTICLLAKLQVGNSSCMTHDFGTSSHT